MASTASPSDTPGASWNEISAAGNWPMWSMARGVARCSIVAMLDSGTICPLLPVR